MRSGFVAIAGRPNAGKSTLINALVKEKIAIVSAKPQTTRSEIRGIVNTEDAQIVFTDTPGIHKARHRLETRMNKEAANVIQGVDLIYLVIDGSVPYGPGDKYVLEMVKNTGLPVFLLLNKIDRMKKDDILNTLLSYQKQFSFAEYFPISALKQETFRELLDTTIRYLPEGDPMFPRDIVSDEPENFRIAEIIREKILQLTRQEVPHAVAVQVKEMKTRENGTVYVLGDIYVERDSQKAILIGRKGSMLKKISSEARMDIEKLTDSHVYLELWVKVRPKWREKESDLRALGLVDR